VQGFHLARPRPVAELAADPDALGTPPPTAAP
jgi:hypothetical protein